ncbi:hypothetical protein TKK_0018438 [Trichogramma kaykai]
MALETIEAKRQRLLSIQGLEDKSREFYRMMEEVHRNRDLSKRRKKLMFTELGSIINDVFTRVTDALLYALNADRFQAVRWLREGTTLNIHKWAFTDGRSLLHWLVEEKRDEPHKDYPARVASIIRYLLGNATENYRDARGFTYFHGACMIGDLQQVQRFVNELGVDVDLDAYEFSPLYTAVEYRRKDTVRYLLNRGADPNWCDRRGQSSVLHGLARLRRCDCPQSCRPVEATKRSTVDVIAQLLMDRGARTDARNSRGQTPLEWAVSRLDYDLTLALARRGVDTNDLDKNLSLSSSDYTKYELLYYPVVLYVPEMIQVLTRYKIQMNFDTRLKFLKFWTTARNHEMDHMSTLVSKEQDPYTWDGWAMRDLITKAYRLDLNYDYGFFMGPKDGRRLESEILPLIREIESNPIYGESCPVPLPQPMVDKLVGIRVTERVTLLNICQMKYVRASLILRELPNWRLPDLGDEPIARDVVKRHIANILMRPQLELFAKNTFIRDRCQVCRPYVTSDQMLEWIDDDELVRWCEEEIVSLEKPNENQAKSFILLSFFICVISLIIGIILIYINNRPNM